MSLPPVGMQIARRTKQGVLKPGETEIDAMTNDERDILEIFKTSWTSSKRGGYGRSVRTPWQDKSTFQDSLSCINYGYPYRAHPCSECHLLELLLPNTGQSRFPVTTFL